MHGKADTLAVFLLLPCANTKINSPSVFPPAVRKHPIGKMSFGRMTQNIRNVPTSRSPFCLKHNLELHSKVFVFRSISSFLNQVCIGLIIAQRWTTGFQTKRSWVQPPLQKNTFLLGQVTGLNVLELSVLSLPKL